MPAKPQKRKSSAQNNAHQVADIGESLFVDAPPDGSGDDSDTTDSGESEESEYSGLEEDDSGSDSDDEAEDSSGDEELDEESGSEDSEESESENMTNNNQAEPRTSTVLLDNEPKTKSKATTKNKPTKPTETKKKISLRQKVKLDNDNLNKDVKTVDSKADEYDVDSSDEEDIRNTVGNIPMEWYKELSHIGYDLQGKPISKPKLGDELDEFLNKMDNPDYWRTVKDKTTGQNVRLTDSDVEMIRRMKTSQYVDPNYDPYQPWVDFFTFEKMIHPLTNVPRSKQSFIPSKWEKMKVSKLVHAIKMGWIKPKPPKTEDKDEEEEQFYQLWNDDDQNDILKQYRNQISAPKMALPSHAESYNPPPEYLMTEEEKLAWKEKDPEERREKFIPQKYDSLRKVPAYSEFINERFQRCLDLYLCPRQRKMKMNVDPEDLIPKLPKPKDLQPFPTTQSIIYRGHTSLVRSVSTEPAGQWIVSGSDDHTIRFWEVSTGRCLKTLDVGGVVKCVAWNPNASFSLVTAVVDNNVIIINPGLGDKLVCSNTDDMIESYEESSESNLKVNWHVYQDEEYSQGFRLKVSHSKALSEVVWHGRGDYFAIVQPDGESESVLIHQLSKRRTQNPFKKKKGLVQRVAFHPTRPFLLVATQRYVRVYNLVKQELTKKLMTNCKWVSCLAVHPGGDNIIIGSYDCRLAWFDLDLSSKPYQTLRHHKKAIRDVAYHPRYPLFASASDDGSVIVCHGKVYNDLLQNPLIVPVKILRGHDKTQNLGVLSCVFHPTQPWIFSSAADNTIRLFT